MTSWASARSCIRRWSPAALMREPVNGFYGAPQSIYSDHFLDAAALDGPGGIQARGRADAPGARGKRATGIRRGARALDVAASINMQVLDRAHPRRLPSRVAGRARGAAQRLDRHARLPDDAVPVGRGAARVARHVPGPVRGGRASRAAHPRGIACDASPGRPRGRTIESLADAAAHRPRRVGAT